LTQWAKNACYNLKRAFLRLQAFFLSFEFFAIVLALMTPLIILRIAMLWERRIPLGHDTFQYLQLQYLFFDEAALTGTPPQWIPYMTHGVPSNFWFLISEGVLSLTVLPFAFFLKGLNYLHIFTAGLLFDEFILVLGSVLLARRYFKSPLTVVFVSASLAYTSISSTQIWWNFHILYLLPLLFYCLDRAIREASTTYLFLFSLVSVGLSVGNLPYELPAIVYVVVLFAFSALVVAPKRVLDLSKGFLRKFSYEYVIALLPSMILGAVIILFLRNGVSDIVSYNVGRLQSLTVPLNEFLIYGGYTEPSKYLELIKRVNDNIDNTIYSGILVIPFALIALLRNRSKASYVFGLTAFLVALFTCGTFVSVAFYYLIPFGSYFRHIGLVAPLIKLFLIFYAGFGFESFLEIVSRVKKQGLRLTSSKDRETMLVPILSFSIIVAGAATTLSRRNDLFNPVPWVAETESQLYSNAASVASALSYLIVISLIALILFVSIMVKPRWALTLLVMILLLHVGDAMLYKVENERGRTAAVSENVMGLFEVYHYEFVPERSQDYTSNSRFRVLAPYILRSGEALPSGGLSPYGTIGRFGAVYWTLEPFLFFDPLVSVFRTDFWLKVVDEFYSSYVKPIQYVPRFLGFPIPDSLAYKKLTGYEYPKLQVFSKVIVLSSDVEIRNALTNPEFKGDEIFVLDREISEDVRKSYPMIFKEGDKVKLVDNSRLNSTLLIRHFTFDTLEVEVDTGSADYSILYYADAWHPKWYAFVNGEQAPILRANFAYKAVVIPPGRSIVKLSFGDWGTQLHQISIIILGATLFASIIYLTLNDLEIKRSKQGRK